MREYRTLKALRAGETVEVEGFLLRMATGGEVSVGDFYVAERNTGPKFLIANKVHPEGWVEPESPVAYSYDLWECCRVEVVEDPTL